MNSKIPIIKMAKNHFVDLYNKSGDPNPYIEHVSGVEKIVGKILKDFPEADKNILFIAVWLHDIGSFLGERDVHEINSEKESRRFLADQGLDDDSIEKVAHCVRAHRCGNVKPATIEAKILAVADSAEHLVAGPYINMMHKYGKEFVIGKLERDFRDIGLLPNIKNDFTRLYEAWKNLLEIIPE